ncbi:tyrosine-type recombinase/integrase [Actinoplanes sp. NPDC051411]|uniref:tyrosine-type recombinase/integrase n=1 Tax=Actinoplanes sp. NPDC051411 TaxID=3155522 RepID=UPI0034466CA6
MILGVGGWRSFPVQLADGSRYWTVIDSEYRTVPAVDEFMQHLYFGRGLAENTTAAYAGSLVLFFTWLARSGCDLETAPGRFGRFMTFLKHYDKRAPNRPLGPGLAPLRGGRRGNSVLAAVREFYKFLVDQQMVSADAINALYRLGPLSESQRRHNERTPREPVALPRHIFPVEDSTVDNATPDEISGLLEAVSTQRDVFIIVLLSLAGLRRGEAVGLRVEDLHFMDDSSRLGCHTVGPHLHVLKRRNLNRASAKSGGRVVPAHPLVVYAYDDYWLARAQVPAARDSDYVLVNLYREPLGRPMSLKSINDLVARLAKRAGLERHIAPHMLRHAFGTQVMEASGAIDVVQKLLGHLKISSTQVYIHPSSERQRAAVNAIAFPARRRSRGVTA